jgi:hypothetical protein
MASKELALQRGSGYGEEIARLNRSEAFLKDAVQFAQRNKIPPSTSQNAEALLHLIGSTRATAQHDLDTIYLESIPADNTLVAITGVAMVKPSALPDYASIHGPEPILFKEVMPKELLALNIQFYERVNNLFSVAASEAEFATSNARTALSSVGLPGSLEASKCENPLPDGLWMKVSLMFCARVITINIYLKLCFIVKRCHVCRVWAGLTAYVPRSQTYRVPHAVHYKPWPVSTKP